MKKFRIRCSSLSAIMADPAGYPRDAMSEAELEALASKKRSPEQVQMLADVMARTISEGAKEHIHKMVKRHLFDYPAPELGSKEVRKGIMQEGTAIDLLSTVSGELYTKNKTRFNNDYLSGEPDLLADDHGNDTKCPWSLEQFPIVEELARKAAIASGYEWQDRGYMLLTEKPRWGTVYCMVDTPSELLPPWESGEAHNLHGIPLHHRVTQVWFERDFEIERRIEKKCRAALAYAEELIAAFKAEKGGDEVGEEAEAPEPFQPPTEAAEEAAPEQQPVEPETVVLPDLF